MANTGNARVDVRDAWTIYGDFGCVAGEVQAADAGLAVESGGLRVEMTDEAGVAGVHRRRTIVRNVADKPLAATCLLDVFRFEGGGFEVYTQANSWMEESRGAWQPLHTGVVARGGAMRSSSGAAPVLALWNRQTARGHVFHILSDGAWEMRASISTTGFIRVETGYDSQQLCYVLQPGETLALPEVIHYDFTNTTDLDCHRLHAWWNAQHPGRRLPTFYNTWLCRFDKLDFDFVLKQVASAKDLGLDYFVVDAGWFGPAKGWTKVRGDWKESPDGALRGRLADLSAAVRASGLKFGFWLEAEIADAETDIVREHPEYFRLLGKSHFLDFTRDEARGYLLETVCGLLEKYQASFIKFDFNCDPEYDESGRAFIDYVAGYRRFLRDVRARNPGVYLEGCASGGLMMDLGWAREFDSFWLSDNQSPVYGLRIVKETMLRMPPRLVERWITARSADGLQPDSFGGDSRLLVTEDAWFRDLRSIAPGYVTAFATGGPLGFSCDLTAFSVAHKDHFRKMVAATKQDSAFWCEAVGRILCDEPGVTALQYSDVALRDVRIEVATDRALQPHVTVHPVLEPALVYEHGGRCETGAVWMERGVDVKTDFFMALEFRFSASAAQRQAHKTAPFQ